MLFAELLAEASGVHVSVKACLERDEVGGETWGVGPEGVNHQPTRTSSSRYDKFCCPHPIPFEWFKQLEPFTPITWHVAVCR